MVPVPRGGMYAAGISPRAALGPARPPARNDDCRPMRSRRREAATVHPRRRCPPRLMADPGEVAQVHVRETPAPEQREGQRGWVPGSGATSKRRTGGDWAAHGAGEGPDGKGNDFLANLGKAQDYNINVDHGQSWQHIDYIFAGDFLGKKSDIADGSLRNYETRNFGNLQGDYYIAPRFLEAVAMHLAKNILCDKGHLNARVPLILGIWGGKGQGKSFQTELAFKKLGVEPIIMSAGELEHEVAGTPGSLIRERYRKAALLMKNTGKLSCLMINDLDAGIGRFHDTQCTVNNQMVVGTLMNLCDDPNRVSVGNKWIEEDLICRVPIVVTGNDFSRVYAPLIRDGRMEKFYWSPTDEDMRNFLHAMYKDDGLTMEDMGVLLQEFPHQTLDFFGAIRASCYDNHIRSWLFKDVLQGLEMDQWTAQHIKDLRQRLVFKQGLPNCDNVTITMDIILAEGRRLVQEQEHVMGSKLSEEYMKDLKKEKEMAAMAPPPPPTPPLPPPMEEVRVDTSHLLRKELEARKAAGTLEYITMSVPGVEKEQEEEKGPWLRVKPQDAMEQLLVAEGYTFVDIRPAKDFGREAYNEAVNIPAVEVVGFGAARTVTPLDSFLPAVRGRFPDQDAKILVCGGEGGEFAEDAIIALTKEGYTSLAEVRGGFLAWARTFRSNGERRWTFSPMQHLGDACSLHM